MKPRATGGVKTMEFAVNAASWVVGKALSPVVGGFLEAWAASNGFGDNVEAIKRQLVYAKVILENAQGREIRGTTLKELLLKLRGLAYDADDVLDELEYFRIQDEILGTRHAVTDTGGCVQGIVLNARHTCRAVASKLKLPSSSRRLKFDRVAISRKMVDIAEQLKQICDQVSSALNLEPYRTIDIAMHRPQTTPGTIEPQLYGRDVQLRSIVDGITAGKYSAHKLTVLSIVGPGGIGKTTFTQHVYQEVKSQFLVPIWICVSLNFNANRLAQDILKQIPKVDGEKENASQEELIEQRLKSKRFLLVLDDIWKYEEDEWKKLISPFSKGEGEGNMVIVTTRFLEVAEKVTNRDDCLLKLGSLGPTDLLEFFGACVFGHEQPWKGHDEFKDVGTQIVEKLKGSPLAAKTVGRLLRTHRTNLQQWTRVLGSKEWENQTSDSDIMPALKLSYDYLPFHLQQCFSYCAMFPEDYEFDTYELIHLWIGLDILHALNQNESTEDVGHRYLEDLVNYGFLKKNERDDGHPYYVLHDLLHELAVKVSSEECVNICGSNLRSIQIPASVRHLSITIDEEVVNNRATFEHYKKEFINALGRRLKVENLRTLMLFGKYQECLFMTFCDLFKDATALRTVLCRASYNVEELLPNLPKLVHLRYIRILEGICGQSILPGTISTLYQLKILDAQGCRGELPRHINNLQNLQYFLVSDYTLHSRIIDVGKLEHLRELRRFEVKKEIDDLSKKRDSNGFELKQLGKLLELQVLGIYNLGNVAVKEEARETNLIQKNRLQELTLDWHVEGTKQSTQEDDILECLKPHSNLRKLWIRGHGGTKCPTWLGVNLSVQQLEYLCLDDVAWENLPSLGGLHMVKESCETGSSKKFRNLRRLELVDVQNLKKWVGIGSCQLFSHLEVLIIKGCKELLELSFSDPACNQLEKAGNMDLFSSLKVLEIEDCPILSHLPSVPWTQSPCSATIKNVNSSFEEINYTNDFELEIQGKDSVADSSFWKVFDFDNLTGLKELDATKCPALPLDLLSKLSSLKRLIISESNTSFWLVENESSLRYKYPVERIEMNWCNTNGKELTQLLSYFPELSSLIISDCKNIRVLSVAEQPTTSTADSSTRRKVLGWLMSYLPNLFALSTWYYPKVRGPSVAMQPRIAYQQQQQVAAEGEEEEIHAASAAADGLLLLPTQLEVLEIQDYRELSLHHPNSKAGGTGGGLQSLRCLRSFKIWSSSDSPPTFPLFAPSNSPSFVLFPAPLQVLLLYCTKGRETPVPLSNLTSLTELHILKCEGLRVELLAHGSLTKLVVMETPNFFVGCEPPPQRQEGGIPSCSSLSSNLQELYTDDAAGVLAAPICTLLSSSLTNLGFTNTSEPFSEEQEEALQHLASLQYLQFNNCEKLQRLPTDLHKLLNLKGLHISCSDALRSLPKGGLPSSLQELCLRSCPAIQSLPKDTLPSSLQVLEIQCCPAIRSLPKVDSLPSSLRKLDVRFSKSDELRGQCRKLRGIIPVVYA